MKKFYCDKCGIEIIGDGIDCKVQSVDQNSRTALHPREFNLCEGCGDTLVKWLYKKVKRTDDFGDEDAESECSTNRYNADIGQIKCSRNGN